MKKHLHFLRTLFLAALTLLCIFNAAAQTSDTLYIYHQGAVVFKRSVAQIDSMSYSQPSTSSINPPLAFGTVNSPTGRVWMDRNLGASRVATSSTDDQAYGDLYQGGRVPDGHQKRDSHLISVNQSIGSPCNPNHVFFQINVPDEEWVNALNFNPWEGVNSRNNPCPLGYRVPTEMEWKDEIDTWTSKDANGAINSSLKLPMSGYRDTEIEAAGTNGFYWTSDFSGSGLKALLISEAQAIIFTRPAERGISVRCIKDQSTSTISTAEIISPLFASNTTPTSASFISDVTDDGGAALTARGVVWSTSENPTIDIPTKTNTGTESGEFLNVITGLSPEKTYYARAYASNRAGVVYGPQIKIETLPQIIVSTVTNPLTGKTWMDRNLGANRIALSLTDEEAYGDLYQWGRDADGHEKRNSTSVFNLCYGDVPGHDMFVLPINNTSNWLVSTSSSLWHGVNGTNNPCPVGFRIPTLIEWKEEVATWNFNNAETDFTSSLKLPLAGFRSGYNGLLQEVGTEGYYWMDHSQLIPTDYQQSAAFSKSSGTGQHSSEKKNGLSVRCIKD